jgi:uncharacterized protein (TIGR03083 family)
MTDPATSAIEILRRAQDDLVALVSAFGPEQLEAQSACSEWSVAFVLSHLGAGAEMSTKTLSTGKADFSDAQSVWDRWNAMPSEEKAERSLSAGEGLVAEFEAQDHDARMNRKIDVGYMPAPVDIAFCAQMRMSELALHRWDVEVPFDPDATVASYFVPTVLARQPLFAGFFAKPTGASGKVAITTTDPAQDFVLEFDPEGVRLGEGSEPSATAALRLPAESFVRLLSGRLAPEYTPSSVEATGDVSLDVLRQLFPGY